MENEVTLFEENGSKRWINKKGETHRVDGPAYIHDDGTQAWWFENKIHRIDGPAVIRPSLSLEWHVNDHNITQQVETWIEENNFPDYTLWTESHKMMFRLVFSGTAP